MPEILSGRPETLFGTPETLSGTPEILSGTPESVSGRPEILSRPFEITFAGLEMPFLVFFQAFFCPFYFRAHSCSFCYRVGNKEFTEEEIADLFEEPKDTTRIRIQRLNDKCGLEELPGKKQRTPDQLVKWSRDHCLVIEEDGELVLSHYHYVGEGRQLELELKFE